MPKNVPAPQTAPPAAVPTAALTVFRLAALFTFLAVAMGAVVCATGSGAACATWPGCQPDQITPQWQLNPMIEFVHRVVAMSAGPLVLAAAVMSRRLGGQNRWLRILLLVALVGAIAAGAFGRLVVLSGLATWLGAVDLFCALTAMTAMGVAAVMAGAPGTDFRVRPGQWHLTQVRSLAALSVLVVVAMHVSGIFAAGKLSFTRCMGWPIWQLIDSDLHPWLQSVRLGLAAVAVGLVLSTAVVAMRHERLRGWGIALATLFAAEMALGLVIHSGGINAAVAAAYSVLAVALLSCLGLLTAVAWAGRIDSDVTSGHVVPSRRESAEPTRR
jgi:cytochrome c oxidase assembly protein subunit 15